MAAELYELEKVEVGIEDYKNNYTRFFVIGKGQTQRQKADLEKKYKTSLVFALIDKPGALLDCLSEFGKRKINLVKLESRPRRLQGTQGFNYIFYLDFEGHYQDENCQAALLDLLSKAAFVKLQGSYPKAVNEAPGDKN